MKDLDITRHAKGYLDALAQGVDPISGEPVPGDSVLSQDRLRRCFRYVSGVLAEVIAEQTARETAAAAPSPERVQAIRALLAEAGIPDKVVYSPDPERSLGGFVGELNAMLRPLGARPIQSASLFLWLKEKGTYTQADPQADLVLTQLGRELGLSAAPYVGEGKKAVSWRFRGPEPAQRLIAENLEEFLLWDDAQWDAYLSCVCSAAAGRPYLSQNRIGITGLVRDINALAPGGQGKRLTAEMVRRWLIRQGHINYDEKGKDSSQAVRFPTERGRAIGIILESSGRYQNLYYSPAAQRFVLDHLTEIVDMVRFLPTLPGG